MQSLRHLHTLAAELGDEWCLLIGLWKFQQLSLDCLHHHVRQHAWSRASIASDISKPLFHAYIWSSRTRWKNGCHCNCISWCLWNSDGTGYTISNKVTIHCQGCNGRNYCRTWAILDTMDLWVAMSIFSDWLFFSSIAVSHQWLPSIHHQTATSCSHLSIWGRRWAVWRYVTISGATKCTLIIFTYTWFCRNTSKGAGCSKDWVSPVAQTVGRL